MSNVENEKINEEIVLEDKKFNVEDVVKKLSNNFMQTSASIEELVNNEILRYSTENGINEFLIELEASYEERVRGDIVSFLKNIDALDKTIYINYVEGIEGYRVEPLIFQNQKANIEKYKIILD